MRFSSAQNSNTIRFPCVISAVTVSSTVNLAAFSMVPHDQCRLRSKLVEANVVATASTSKLIDDFAHGLRDWSVLNAGNATHQQLWTRKITDPLYRGPDDAKLQLTLSMPQTNQLSFVVHENEWRSYRGPRKTFVCQREINGMDTEQTVTLDLSDFVSSDGPLKLWRDADQFGICAYFHEQGSRGKAAQDVPRWNGPAPTFARLEWI